MPTQLAIAVITAPRPRPTFDDTVREIRWGGFRESLHVFAEPGSTVGEHAGLQVHWNARRLGMWRNWLHAAKQLLRVTSARRLLLLEDDLLLAHGAAAALDAAFESTNSRSLGYFTLYTPEHHVWDQSLRYGWQPLRKESVSWGSLALAFTRESLQTVVHTCAANLHMRPNETDYVLTRAAREAGRQIYFHTPSLCAHEARNNSTVGHVSLLASRAVRFDRDYHPRLAELYATTLFRRA